jgi:hypothetical protein
MLVKKSCGLSYCGTFEEAFSSPIVQYSKMASIQLIGLGYELKLKSVLKMYRITHLLGCEPYKI